MERLGNVQRPTGKAWADDSFSGQHRAEE